MPAAPHGAGAWVVAAWLLAAFAGVRAQGGDEVEIDFEPLGGGGGSIFQGLGGAGGPFGGQGIQLVGPDVQRAVSQTGSADPLEEMMRDLLGPPRQQPQKDPIAPQKAQKAEAMLDDMIAGLMGPGGPNLKGRGRVTQKRLGDGTVIIEQDMPMGPMGAGGPMGLLGGMPTDMRSSLPVGLIRDLFPGPHLQQGEMHPMPFNRPDPMIADMMQDLDRAFTNNLMPTIQRAAGVNRVPDSCAKELSTHCAGDIKSPLHCLGQHPEDISEMCRKDVGKSVPFLCSPAIDKFCDVLENGLLNCLGDHLSEIDGPCKDAVVATRHVISKANSQKASISDQANGEKKVSLPAGVDKPADTPVSLTQREAGLDQKLQQANAAVDGRDKEANLDKAIAKIKEVAAAAPSAAKPVKTQEAAFDAALAKLPPAPAPARDSPGLRKAEKGPPLPASPTAQAQAEGGGGSLWLLALLIFGLGVGLIVSTDPGRRLWERLTEREGLGRLKSVELNGPVRL